MCKETVVTYLYKVRILWWMGLQFNFKEVSYRHIRLYNYKGIFALVQSMEKVDME